MVCLCDVDSAGSGNAAHRRDMTAASSGVSVAALLPKELVFAESDVTVGEIIGKGSFGETRRGAIRGMPVCVKVSVSSLRPCDHSKLCPNHRSLAGV